MIAYGEGWHRKKGCLTVAAGAAAFLALCVGLALAVAAVT